ncbi:GNAT family N-acetyltransferase [Salipaludibacillus sp. HK11]|uniref:GNAT family N-acetyltransferase n=1 Tax=Salipaludibacillus sp. HK11 TaxID=3394320 RepID=UPI0039FBE2A4
MITSLFTERLYLRKMVPADSASLFKIWSDPDITKFMNISNFSNEGQATEMIHYINALSKENKAIRFSIIELTSNEIIGSCGFNYFDFENAKAEIGYDIAKQSWGKGYAPEAISSLLNYGFETIEMNRIEAKIEPGNINSIKVLRKLNFTFEGTLRQAEKIHGKFIDLNMYSKLNTD